ISINGGTNPKQNNPFSVTVQSQNASSVAANVFTSTTVTLTLATGSGTLGGTLTGMIAAGTNTITISGASYSVAQSGVSVTATASGGDPLTSATSATFTVDAPPSSYTVTTTNDSGTGSLREALTLANSGGCTPACTIGFNIAGANPQTIALASPLPPVIQSGATIDGTTQPGYAGTPVIVINGSAAGAVAGLQIGANSVTIKGLVINGFSATAGIDLNGDGVSANDAGDADSGGADNLQNTPVILDAALVSGTLNVHVSVDSSSVGTTGSIRVELFKADSSGAEGTTKIAGQCFAG